MIISIFSIKEKAAASVEMKEVRGDVDVEEREEGMRELFRRKRQ